MKNYKTDKVTYLSALPRTWGINSQPRFNSHTTMYKHVLHVKQLPKRFHCPSAFILRSLTKTSHWKYAKTLPNVSTTPITQGTTMKPHKTREKFESNTNLTALCWYLQMSSRTFNARTREEILELVPSPIYRLAFCTPQTWGKQTINWAQHAQHKIHQRYITARHFRTKHTYTLISF